MKTVTKAAFRLPFTEDLRHTEQNKKIYAKCKETIERIFAAL
ncbi:hypothetical protein [Paenibacillus sp. Lou8.1]|nr:hypothetical protein [Paenibacillus sp. Lou8.1]